MNRATNVAVGNTTAKKILSINGSASAPNLDVTFHFLASLPSNKSVNAESIIRINAEYKVIFEGLNAFKIANAPPIKIRGARTNVKKLTKANWRFCFRDISESLLIVRK